MRFLACMFHNYREEYERNEIVPEIAAACRRRRRRADALSYYDMCLARGSDSCSAFDAACADAFGGLSACINAKTAWWKSVMVDSVGVVKCLLF